MIGYNLYVDDKIVIQGPDTQATISGTIGQTYNIKVRAYN